MRVFLWLLLSWAWAAQAFADTRLNEAIQHYLADQDALALPGLAELAAKGDTDAQVLLGRIATRPHSEYVQNLTRAERKALLRAPGGLSGKSWLDVAAANGDARAKAFANARGPRAKAADVLALLDIGEDEAAAALALRGLHFDSTENVRKLLEDASWEEDARYIPLMLLATRRELQLQEIREAVDRLSNADSPKHRFLVYLLDHGFFDIDQRDFTKVIHRLAGDFLLVPSPDDGSVAEFLGQDTSRPTRRAYAFCEEACPDSVRSCVGDVFPLVGGYDALWSFGSPVQSLIPNDRYEASARALVDISRHARTIFGAFNDLRELSATASCAGAYVFRD